MSRTFIRIALVAACMCAAASFSCVGDEPESTASGDASTNDTGADTAFADSQGSCPDGKASCGASCVDLQSDDANCGKCGNACSGCYLGTCDGKKVVDVSAGYDSACVVLAAGTVWCWGGNESAQLGEPPGSQTCSFYGADIPCRPAPAEVTGLGDVAHVSVGVGAACALKHDGTVWCWGRNSEGQLGHDPFLDTTDGGGGSVCGGHCNPTPKPVTLANGTPISGMTALSATAYLACASGPTATYCWGTDAHDERGTGAEDDGGTAYRAPLQVAGITGATAVATGSSFTHACAISNGHIFCWGDNFEDGLGHVQGSLGDVLGTDGRYQNSTAREAEEYLGDGGLAEHGGIVSIAALDGPSCAVMSDHSLSCWGFQCYGAVGYTLDPSNCNNVKTAFASGSYVSGVSGGFSAIAGSSGHACAIAATTGQVYCWGVAWGGQLGNGSTSASHNGADFFCPNSSGPLCIPTPVQATAVLATTVSAFQDFTLAIGTDGKVRGWGVNNAGQTGHPPSTQSDVTCNRFTDNAATQCNATPVEVIGLP